ncbi:hypothetical protein SZ55_2722 [Pseudomonas sp. FeS53a]|nr:hypothetical protein SZ55_2722 [Pseudomonas sp. FeS53a]
MPFPSQAAGWVPCVARRRLRLRVGEGLVSSRACFRAVLDIGSGGGTPDLRIKP